MVLTALHRHRADAPLWVAAAFLHVAFIAAWLYFDTESEIDFEHHLVTTAMVIAAFFYGVVIVAFWWARKTRLNKALALQKFYWAALILTLALPAHTDWWEVAPGWLRSYIWLGLVVTSPWVLFEFATANWGDEWDGKTDRRKPGVAGRRDYDQFPDAGPGQERR